MLLRLELERSGYGSVTVLEQLAIEVAEGESIAILGNNGVGKTTLLRTISGVMVNSRGRLSFDGSDITKLRAHQRTRRGISHVPEGRQVFAELTVAENIQVGAFAVKRGGGDLKRRIAEMEEMFPILGQRRDQLASQLSGGEQQMLAIARGLVMEPRLLMVDEASLGLSPVAIDAVYTALAKIRREAGLSMIVVEQNVTMALAVTDRAYVLDRGQVSLTGPSAELAKDHRITDVYLGVRVDGDAELVAGEVAPSAR